MRLHDIWEDQDGAWVQVGAQTHGPFATAEKAERRAESIAIGGECGCEECLLLLGAAINEAEDSCLFRIDGDE